MNNGDAFRRFFLSSAFKTLTLTSLLFLSITTSATDIPLEQKPFLLLNEMRFSGQPDIAKLGFQDIRVIYTGELWRSKKAENNPDLSFIEAYIDNRLKDHNILCLDIEHWPMDIRRADPAHIEQSIGKFNSILSSFRTKRPDAKLGIYGMLPIRDYHAPVKNEGLYLWKNANQKLAPLAKNVDYIYPSIYTFYKSPNKWKKYAIANINEAKKYGKPVIPFIWPQYHGSNKLRKHKFIGYDYWRLQLETIYEHADGIVLWSPAGELRSNWDDDAEWWKATIDFIQEHDLDSK